MGNSLLRSLVPYRVRICSSAPYMKFQYLRNKPTSPEEDFSEKVHYLPCIKIKVTHEGKTSHEFPALIDSGACMPFFSYYLAEELFHIDPEDGTKIPVLGVGGGDHGFIHKDMFEIIVGGFAVPTRICFMSTLLPGFVLLGREGLFDYFKVSFNDRKRILELKPYKAEG